IHL
ncbi:ABC transporter family protein, partial [Vibrio parahaemolyticus V-223/04]